MSHRVRIRYTKDGRTRFVSARDVASIWERALRRAGLPIAYSEGYTPHPKISFPDALPVGVASTGEYAELTFSEPVDAGAGLHALSATLPAGMRIATYQSVPDGAPKLARLLEATLWELAFPGDGTTDQTTVGLLARLGEAVLAAGEAPVVRTKPDGSSRIIDLRPGLVAVHADLTRTAPDPDRRGRPGEDAPPVPTLRVIVRNDGPAIRPGDLTTVLATRRAPDDPALPPPRLLRRVVQGRLAEGGIAEALSGALVPIATDGPPGKRDDHVEPGEPDRRGAGGGATHAHAHPRGAAGAGVLGLDRGRRARVGVPDLD